MSDMPPADRPETGDPQSDPVRREPEVKPAEPGRRRPSATPVMPRFAPEVEPPQARGSETGRHAMPQTPVRPQFADAPTSPDTPGGQPSRTRRGCALPVLGIGVIALALVALALFLPPVSLWDRIDGQLNGGSSNGPDVTQVGGLTFFALSPSAPQIAVDGLTIAVEPAALTSPFSVHVLAVSPADYLAGRTLTPAEGWFCETDLPEHHALASPVYSLAQNGTSPGRFSLQVEPSPDAGTDPGALELHVWNATSGMWQFWPSLVTGSGALAAQIDYLPRCVALLREAESLRRVGLTLAVTDTFSPDMVTAHMRVYPGSLRPTATGALQVVLAPGFETGQGYDVLPLIQNFEDPAVVDIATLQRIIENPALRTEHARLIAAFILGNEGYAGVAIDYRALPVDLRDAYTLFVRELVDLLHTQNRLLTVVLPAPDYDPGSGTWNTGGYDWPALGRYADEVAVMMPLDPGAYVPGAEVDQLLDWATTQITRGKLLMGLEALSVEDQGRGVMAPVTVGEALDYLGVQVDPSGPVEAGQTVTARLYSPGVQADFGRDADAQTPFIRYNSPDGVALRTMWLTDPDALDFRLERAVAHNLNGIYVQDAMKPGTLPGLETALLAYGLNQPGEASIFDPIVVWTARAGTGVIEEKAAAPGEPFTVEVPADVTELVVEARMNGKLLGSQTLTVAVPEPTGTPAPVDTPTPSELAAPTGTPVPVDTLAPEEAAPTPPTGTPLPAETPPPTGTATPDDSPSALDQPIPTVDPAILAGADVGSVFETGVVVSQLDRTLLDVGRTHLAWIKLEITYRIGATPAAQQQNIEQAQANGLKILLNVAGDPAEFETIDRADYIEQFVTYIGGLASYGVDGIEIWRDMNGQMPAADYVQLLGRAYYAIKTANPSTLVITGALTPIEAPETPDQDDGVYVGQLADAGAGQYADCIGVQYLAGTVSPATTSGDPRGDNPVYYLPTVTDRAWNAFGGTLPVCYTRLGYLSPEGYPPLPEGYTWAQNTTAAQQAAWLADAVQLGMAGSQVRLLVIWVMSAAQFEDGSPQVGYAIIRPDGSCPACDALEPLLSQPE